ncbi:MAG: hypothetical protein GY928_36590 [Colwellia sp.]|nr:hypothetical protein [Colwellia sp.]
MDTKEKVSVIMRCMEGGARILVNKDGNGSIKFPHKGVESSLADDVVSGVISNPKVKMIEDGVYAVKMAKGEGLI